MNHLRPAFFILTFLIPQLLSILFLPGISSATDCRKYQNEMIRYVKTFRGNASASVAPFYSSAVSRNAQRNSKLALANQSGQNFFRYPTYAQVAFYGYNDNLEAKIGNSWVVVNAGGNWDFVAPASVANKLVESQGEILGTPAATKIGVGCEESQFIGRSYVQNGFRYRRHIIKRAWTIAQDTQ